MLIVVIKMPFFIRAILSLDTMNVGFEAVAFAKGTRLARLHSEHEKRICNNDELKYFDETC